jgi:hypothetical protein
MQRFHFDIVSATGTDRDEHGEVCADRNAAEAEAVKIAIEMVRHGLGGQTHLNRTIEVRDESDEPFSRVRLALNIETQRLK